MHPELTRQETPELTVVIVQLSALVGYLALCALWAHGYRRVDAHIRGWLGRRLKAKVVWQQAGPNQLAWHWGSVEPVSNGARFAISAVALVVWGLAPALPIICLGGLHLLVHFPSVGTTRILVLVSLASTWLCWMLVDPRDWKTERLSPPARVLRQSLTAPQPIP